MNISFKVLLLLLSFHTFFGQSVRFDARSLLYLSDSDMSAYAFEDGLDRNSKDFNDQLTAIKFPLAYGAKLEESSTPVSNSVLTYGDQVCITSNQRLAYILESFAETELERASNGILSQGLPSGQYITVVDLSNPHYPRAQYRFPAGQNPKSISLSPDNQYLAVCSDEYGKELQIFELDGAGKPTRVIKKPNRIEPGRISHVAWTSDNNALIYLNQDAQLVGLIKVLRDGPTNQIIRLEGDSRTIRLEGLPVYGKFTPDKKYFLVMTAQSNFFGDNRKNSDGTLFVIKFSDIESSESHFLLSKIKLSQNPISFDIHPEGSLVAVVQAENSTRIPTGSSKAAGSINLIDLKLSGNLFDRQIIEVEGMLPNKVLFDKDGKNLAISIYQYFNFGFSFGGIEFFDCNLNDKNVLKKQSGKIFLPRGVHSIFSVVDY